MTTALVTRTSQLASGHLWLARNFGLRVPVYLDGYEAYVVAAHSLRQLRAAYVGPLLKVRNGTSNAEATVAPAYGFFASDAIVTVTAAGTSGYSVGQTMTVATFMGSDDLRVSRSYDQFASAYDMAQATANLQPRIGAAGVLVTDQGLPAIEFDGTTRTMASLTSFARTQPQTVIWVGTPTTTSALSRGTSASFFLLQEFDTGMIRLGSGVNLDTVMATNGIPTVYAATFDGASSKLFVNGDLRTTGNAGTNGANGMTWSPQNAKCFEHILLNTNNQTVVQEISRLVAAHYGSVA